jgi:hypothetical protein
LFSKLKSHELSYKGHLNHDASLNSKTLITGARDGGHEANPTNNVSSSLEFALSSLATVFDKQYESILDDEIALLARKFHNERRRTPRCCIECGDTTDFTPTAPRGRSSTPPKGTTTPTGMTLATRAITRRSTTLGQEEEEEVLEDYVIVG